MVSLGYELCIRSCIINIHHACCCRFLVSANLPSIDRSSPVSPIKPFGNTESSRYRHTFEPSNSRGNLRSSTSTNANHMTRMYFDGLLKKLNAAMFGTAQCIHVRSELPRSRKQTANKVSVIPTSLHKQATKTSSSRSSAKPGEPNT